MTLIGNTTVFKNAVFDHRAVVERNSASDTDHRAAENWSPHIAAQPCFFYWSEIAEGRESEEVDRTAVIETPTLMLPLGADVTERDRINGVTHKDGTTIAAGVHEILSVTRRHTHLQAKLRAVG